MKYWLSLLLFPALILAALLPAAANAAVPARPSAEQSGQFTLLLPQGRQIELAEFRPACAKLRGAAVLFPGYRRNSKAYRSAAEPLARRLCLLIYVPRFPAADFPVADYQHGGAGLAAARPLLAEIQRRAAAAHHGAPLPLLLIGHSAGAQYLSRLAAYSPPAPAPRRYILLSGGSYVFAVNSYAPPYGFSGLPPAQLKAYLAAPISIITGGADIKANAHLSQTPAAKAQGANRLARAQNAFSTAQTEAAALHTPFNWDFAIIPGLGHDESALLASPALAAKIQKSLP